VYTDRGCQYLGCEDVAVEHVVIPGDPIPHDLFFCPGHGPYVKRALGDASVGDVRVAPVERAGERTRVWVARPQTR
jgi:hypothetical protein